MSTEDRWAHRAAHMRCRTCMYFVPKVVAGFPEATTEAISALERCRRHAPTLSGWPAVFVDDWCGDHKLDETKLEEPA